MGLIDNVLYKGQYLFIGSFSTEAFKLVDRVHHLYRSFTFARNDFCLKISSGSAYRIIGSFNLGNKLMNSVSSTGDHDGYLTVLEASK